MKKIILTKAQKEQYLENESDNLHTENIVFLGHISGNKDIIIIAESIKKIHDTEGRIPNSLFYYREEISKRLEELIDFDNIYN